jgi:serine/threonine-protein kinase
MHKVGRYNIISELGRGAMGIVYKASDPTIGREVALKVLTITAAPGEGTNSPQEMFIREVRAAGRLAHPSIVTIHDAFDDPVNQTGCIVMELVPGTTLEKILESGRSLSVEQTFSLVRQVAEALDYAHRNQVIHRDLKPANILVTEDGRAKITDFGIAKVLAREGLARTVGMMGTPSYMSPEQVRGGDVDARTDIFSLGIIAYTMLSGKKPFGGNTAAVMFKIVYEEPPKPSSVNPRLTADHDYWVAKCLAKDRNQRYASARALLDDLDDLQHGRRSRSRPVAVAPAAQVMPHPDRTLAMPVPRLGSVAPPSPPRPAASKTPWTPPPQVAAQMPTAGRPPAPRPSSLKQTLAMAIPGLLKGAAQPSPSTAAPASPSSLAVPPQVVPAPDRTQPPDLAQALTVQAPGDSALASSVPPMQPAADVESADAVPTLLEQTVRVPAADLSAESSPALPYPNGAPLPSIPVEFSSMESTVPIELPGVSGASEAAGPPPETFAPPQQPDVVIPTEWAEASVMAPPARKSKLVPILFGAVAVILLGEGVWIYWKFHRSSGAPAPTPQATVQTQPAAPPTVVPSSVPAASSTPAPPATTETPSPPLSAPPVTAKKPAVHRAKPAHASGPAPPPTQPEPVVAPPANPAPSSPSPQEIARAEAAKAASTPRVVQVVCNFELKEATFTIAGGGQTLFEDTFKAKRKKAGFLGIKGSYQGTFTHSVTVPAGAQELSIRVVARDGAMDMSRAVKMPLPGGFIPTLRVEVDSEHVSANWNNSSGAN